VLSRLTRARRPERAAAHEGPLAPHLADAIFAAVTRPDTGPLERLVGERTILTIALADRPGRQYTSIVLEVDRARGHLVLDELSGGGLPGQLLDTHPEFHAEGTLTGARIAFSSSITATAATADGRRYHRVPLPKDISYRGTRAYARIPMPMSPGIAVRFGAGRRHHGGAAGILRDVSAGGFSATLTFLPEAPRPTPGERIDHCLIDCPGGRRLLTAIEICHVRHLPFVNTLKLGAKFLDGPRPELVARLLYDSPDTIPASA